MSKISSGKKKMKDDDDPEEEIEEEETEEEEEIEEEEPEKRSPKKSKRAPVEDEYPKEKGPNPIVIFVVIAVIMIIVGGILYTVFNNPDFEDAFIGNMYGFDTNDDLYDDTLYIPVIASANSVGSTDGTGKIGIYFGDEENPIYETDVSIKDDRGSIEIPFDRFVIGNGDYTVRLEAGSGENEKNYNIRDVVEKIEIEWTEETTPASGWGNFYQISYKIRPQNADGSNLISFPSPFSFEGSLRLPDGTADPLSFDRVTPGYFYYSNTATHTDKGEYRVTGTWANDICMPTSKYKTIQITEDNSLDVDFPPEANAGPDLDGILVNGNASVSFDGSGSWDDGTVVQYMWDFGDHSNITTSASLVTHTYHEPGDYYVELSVIDDSGKMSTPRIESFIVVTIS